MKGFAYKASFSGVVTDRKNSISSLRGNPTRLPVGSRFRSLAHIPGSAFAGTTRLFASTLPSPSYRLPAPPTNDQSAAVEVSSGKGPFISRTVGEDAFILFCWIRANGLWGGSHSTSTCRGTPPCLKKNKNQCSNIRC